MSKIQLLIELDEKDYEELNTFYILNLGTEEYRKIIEKHCTDAIRHGTPYNPSGDLISREALRKEVAEKVHFMTVDGHIAYDKVLKLIDSAPAVEAYTPEQVKELVDLNKKLSEECPQGVGN